MAQPGGSDVNRVVLVVCEGLDDQLLITRTVNALGKEIALLTLETGGDALDYIFSRGPYAARIPSEDPDLVIADHDLPDMLAIDLAKSVRESKSELPMLVYAVNIDGDARRYEGLAVDGPITKPTDSAEFQAAVLDAIRRHLRIVD